MSDDSDVIHHSSKANVANSDPMDPLEDCKTLNDNLVESDAQTNLDIMSYNNQGLEDSEIDQSDEHVLGDLEEDIRDHELNEELQTHCNNDVIEIENKDQVSSNHQGFEDSVSENDRSYEHVTIGAPEHFQDHEINAEIQTDHNGNAGVAFSEKERMGQLTSNDQDPDHPIPPEHHNEQTSQALDEPQTIDEQFMKAVGDGNVTAILDFLTKKDELDLNINYVNDNGDTPMRLAVTSGYSVIVEHLLLHGACLNDGLLRAVDIGFEETVEKILEYIDKIPSAETRHKLMNCRSQDDYLHPDVTPIVLAAQKNDFTLVKLFQVRGCKITEVGSKKKEDSESQATDELQKSVGSLEIYKGLASEAYLSQVNEDPVESAFKLSKKLRQLSQTDVEFKATYLELADNTDVIGTEIISYARNTEEIMTVLNYQEKQTESNKNPAPLPKISRAIQYEQKQFVAHQNCQQAILSKFYGGVAFLRDMNSMHRLLVLMGMIIGFPILSLMVLYVPIKRVQMYISCPYTKFIMKFASDFFFVVILTADIVINSTISPDRLSIQTPTKILLLIWILGITWREIKCIYKQKTEILVQFSHWRDILLVVFFLIGVLLDTISYSQYQNSSTKVSVSKRDASYLTIDANFLYDAQNRSGDGYNQTSSAQMPHALHHRVLRQARKPGKGAGPAAGGSDSTFNTDSQDADFLGFDWSHPILIANTLFGMASVIAFLRMLPYVVVSDVIGPLQISLGSMVTQTAHFFLVVALVLFSFAMGLTYIYEYYDETEALRCAGSGETCERGYFRNLFFAMVYLYWSLLGIEDQEALQLNNQAQVLEAAGLLLYAMFYILLILVLFNALIAVMSEAYNHVEENADVEWKFHSTVMWMSILLDDEAVPPPFNMLPSYQSCRDFIPKYLNFKWKRRNSSYPSERKTTPSIHSYRRSSSKSSENGQYKRVMSSLVERYVMAKTADEISVEGGVGFNDIMGLRNDLLSLKVDLHQKLVNTKDHIDVTTIKGNAIKQTSVLANHVLHKAESVHVNVDTSLVKTVLKLQAQVSEYMAQLKTQREQQDMEEARLNGLLSQGALEEARLNELLRQGALEEARLNELLSQGTLKEERLRELLYQGALHEEAGLRELFRKSTIEEAKLNELLSQANSEIARLGEQLSQASQRVPEIPVLPSIVKPDIVDQSTQIEIESENQFTQTEILISENTDEKDTKEPKLEGPSKKYKPTKRVPVSSKTDEDVDDDRLGFFTKIKHRIQEEYEAAIVDDSDDSDDQPSPSVEIQNIQHTSSKTLSRPVDYVTPKQVSDDKSKDPVVDVGIQKSSSESSFLSRFVKAAKETLESDSTDANQINQDEDTKQIQGRVTSDTTKVHEDEPKHRPVEFVAASSMDSSKVQTKQSSSEDDWDVLSASQQSTPPSNKYQGLSAGEAANIDTSGGIKEHLKSTVEGRIEGAMSSEDEFEHFEEKESVGDDSHLDQAVSTDTGLFSTLIKKFRD